MYLAILLIIFSISLLLRLSYNFITNIQKQLFIFSNKTSSIFNPINISFIHTFRAPTHENEASAWKYLILRSHMPIQCCYSKTEVSHSSCGSGRDGEGDFNSNKVKESSITFTTSLNVDCLTFAIQT